MFHPLSVYMGLRYVRARSHTFFVSFITWASLVGVCVVVAALPVLLRGIDPRAAGSATELARAITQGHLADLTPGSGRIIVGEVIAERLGLSPADSLTMLVPTVDAGGAPAPKLREFTVAGTFEV